MACAIFFMFGSELRIYAQNFCHLHTVIVVVLEEFEGKKLWRNPDSHLLSVMKEIGNK